MTALFYSANSALGRRVRLFFAAFGLSLLLAGCGSGSTFEPLVPTRIISFGDGLSDLGQTGNKFTVNDGTVNIWVERVAVNYSKTITAAVSGGLGFAQGGARINGAGNSIESQITTFLSLSAATSTLGASDLILVDAGVAELVALAAATPSDSALLDAADTAGKALAVQVRRLLAAGGKHVVLANAPDIGKTPYASSVTRTVALTATTRQFNDSLKIALSDIGTGLLLVDNEAFVNSIYNSPNVLGTSGNATAAACTGVVTSCTGTANVVANYNVYLFADDRHLAPNAHRFVGENAYAKIKARW